LLWVEYRPSPSLLERRAEAKVNNLKMKRWQQLILNSYQSLSQLLNKLVRPTIRYSNARNSSKEMADSLPPPPESTSHSQPHPPSNGISEDEARLYDRQLRLWGVEAQNRMRSSHILLCGSFLGISTEVAKNIVLAGVGRVTLLDEGQVGWEDLGSGYWFREQDIGLKVQSISLSLRSFEWS